MQKRRLLLVAMVLVTFRAEFSWAQLPVALQGSGGTGSSLGSTQGGGQATGSAPGPGAQEGRPEAPAMPPLSGAEALTPGTAGAMRSYLLPSIQYTGRADTIGSTKGGFSRTEAMSMVAGSLTLQRIRRHSELDLDYGGGGFFYRGTLQNVSNTSPNGMFHRLGFTQSVYSSRWKFLLGDHGTYLPESPYGFGGFGGLESFGLGASSEFAASAAALNPTLMPDQTILTGHARRASNLGVAELEYRAGARSSFTVSGSYGMLRFLDPGFFDNDNWAVLAGYNFALTPRDTISVTYEHLYFRFHVPNHDILNRGFELQYGHRITGRLSLQLSAGPMLNDLAKPLGGSVMKSFISTYDSLQYQFPRGKVGISFLRYMTGGAGVLFGAENDLVSFTAGRPVARRFYAALDLGHAYNRALTSQSASQRRAEYESWQAGINLSREFGRHMDVFLNYYVQRQTSNSPVCSGSTCLTHSLRQVGGVGINLHGRPIRLG